jgi:hypothetical protein
MVIIDKEKQSKNIIVEKLVGKREGGDPFYEPCEMDYACPICCKPITEHIEIFDEKGEIKPEYERLHFSEYNGFMWCENCNIDIPSFLCLNSNSKESVENYTDRFIDFLEKFKERIYHPLTNEEKEIESKRINYKDLKIEYDNLKFEHDLNEDFIKYINSSTIGRIQSILFKIKTKLKRKKQNV